MTFLSHPVYTLLYGSLFVLRAIDKGAFVYASGRICVKHIQHRGEPLVWKSEMNGCLKM